MSSGETEKDSENLSQTNAEQKRDANGDGNGNGNGNEISAAENKNYSYISNDLLEEYHKTVESMRSEITTYEKEQETLSNEVLRLVEENKKLSKELSEANVNKSTADENNVHNLQEQLRTITEARDSAVQMWQNAVQEITRLQHIVQENPMQSEILEEKVSQIQEDYAHAISSLQSELLEAKSELREIKEQYNLTVQELKECKKTCNNFQQQLKLKESTADESQKKYHNCQTKLLNLEMENNELNNRLLLYQQNEEKLNMQIKNFETEMTKLQKQNAELLIQESKAIQQAKESIRVAENAVLQKEEALFREQQALKEAERLQASINQLVENAAQRTKLEVDSIKKRCNENIKNLMEEIYNLELDNNEKQTQYDRVVREKRAAEEELELLHKEGLQSKPQNSLLFDDLTKRLASAEQSRNQAQLKIQSLESEIKKMETCHQHEMSLCSKEKLSLHERVQELQEKFSQICLEKVKVTDEIEQMKQQIKDTEKNGLLLEKNAEKEIKTLKKKLQQQEEEWQYQLRSLEERFQTSAFELQKLLDAQKKMSDKWKAEAKGLADKLEKETKEMYLETLNLQQTNEKLYLELENSQIRIAQSEQQLAEYKAKILNLQQQMKNLQSL
ncbi:sodium channel and clathrin linker 1-like [Centruroides vittatus]|uniref:sodium channel and clathrin linker 1-like n=1 Tax=Centruroides vittatus TaxID=120091 RepID=UPI00350FC0E1